MTKTQGEMKPIIIHNTKELCKCKTFTGMKSGHCVKCKKAFKNCDICYPEEQIHQKQNDFEVRVMRDLDLAIQMLIGHSQDLKDNAVIDNTIYKNHIKRIEKDIIQKAIREAREMGKKEGLQALTRMEIESERTAK